MKEAFTKENIENWLVEFLTSPSLRGEQSSYCYYLSLSNSMNVEIFINPPGSPNWSPLNIFNGLAINIGIDYFPKRALALLAIIHRPAYEFYKKHWIKK